MEFDERYHLAMTLLTQGKSTDVLPNGELAREMYCTATAMELLFVPVRAIRLLVDARGNTYEQPVTFDLDYSRKYGPLEEVSKSELRIAYPRME